MDKYIKISVDKKVSKLSEMFYAADELCPACGRYSASGDVCLACKKEYGLSLPRTSYPEDGE